MTIKEVSEQLEITQDTLRYYEKVGMIPPVTDSTIQQRCNLLKEQREKLLEQRKQIEETLEKLNYKIARYEVAVETGKLTWDKE